MAKVADKKIQKKAKKHRKVDRTGWIAYSDGWHYNPGRGTVFSSGRDRDGRLIWTAYPTYHYDKKKEFESLQAAKGYINAFERKGDIWRAFYKDADEDGG